MDADTLQQLMDLGLLDVEEQSLAKRREQLRGMQEAPFSQGEMVSGHYISPVWRNAAAALNRIAGDFHARKLDQQQRGLGEKRKLGLSLAAQQRAAAERALADAEASGNPARIAQAQQDAQGVAAVFQSTGYQPLVSQGGDLSKWGRGTEERVFERTLRPKKLQHTDQELALNQGKIGDAERERARLTGPATPEQRAMAQKLKAPLRPDATRQDAQEVIDTALKLRGLEARENNPAGLHLFFGNDGQAFGFNPRDGRATPVTGPDGKPVVKQGKPLGQGDRTILGGLATERQNLADLSARFKDDYAGKVAGGLRTSVNQMLGSAGTEAMQEDAQFWADFQRLIELPARNEIFGASLSAGEKQSWENARNISPKTSPKIVRETFSKLLRIVDDKIGRQAGSLEADGYSREALKEITGGLYGGQQGRPDNAANPELEQADAWLKANPNDPRAGAVKAKIERLRGAR